MLGKLALKGVGDIASGTATLGLMVGSVALAVEGTSFTVAKSAAMNAVSISGDQDYADECTSDVVSGLIKIVAAN